MACVFQSQHVAPSAELESSLCKQHLKQSQTSLARLLHPHSAFAYLLSSLFSALELLKLLPPPPPLLHSLLQTCEHRQVHLPALLESVGKAGECPAQHLGHSVCAEDGA